MRQLAQTTLMNWLGALGAVFLICLAQCSAQVPSQPGTKREWRDLINTELFGSTCKSSESTGEKKGLICKGVEGYSLLVRGEPLLLRGEHQKPELYLVAPSGQRFQIQYWDTKDSKFQSLFGVVTWTVVHTPRKTIALILRGLVEPTQDDSGTNDIIVRVRPGSVCVIGSVRASSTSVGESIAIASSPSRRKCLDVKELSNRD